MTLWLLLAFMTAVAVAAILWPLARTPASVGGGNDVAVYRDQLDEVERDRASGAIGAAEAEAARTEVSRRLIAAADAAAADAANAQVQPLWRRRIAGLAALFLVPVAATLLYLRLGSPELPSQPLAERVARAHAGVPMQGTQGQSMEALIARVEDYLEKNPDDGRGWEVIAPVYMRSGNFDAAVKARANALRLLGSTAEREADHGETMVAAANGVVTAEARAAFDRAAKLDAKNVSARYYLGLAAEQDDRKADAVAAWQALIADAPPDAPWADFVKRNIARAEGRPLADAPVEAPEPPRTTADVAKALGMTPPADAPTAAPPAQSSPPPSDPGQDDMIRGMVSRLADRLKQDGSDVDGWIRLVRSYVVLGDAAKARAAIVDARSALGSDTEKLRKLDAGVKDLGLEG